MGYTRPEFTKVLCGPFTGEKSDYRCESVASDHWRIKQSNEAFLLDIHIAKLPNRKLGPLIELPVLNVQFQQQDDNANLLEKFFVRFHQYFHKGGG